MVDRGFTEESSSPLLINIAVTVHREVATAPAYGPGSPVGPVFGPWAVSIRRSSGRVPITGILTPE